MAARELTRQPQVSISAQTFVLGNPSTNGGTLDPASVTVTVAPSCAPDGTTTVNTDGSITFTPINGFTGTCTFTYEVCNTFGACDTAVVTVVVNDQAPGTTIVKTISSAAPGAIGDVITYSIVVTNTGGVTLTNLVVSDPNATLTPDSCFSASLATAAAHLLRFPHRRRRRHGSRSVHQHGQRGVRSDHCFCANQ